MKTVFFDLMCSQPVAGSKFHGGGEYTKTVFRALSKYHAKKIHLNVFYNPNLFIDNWVLELIQQLNIDAYLVNSYSEVSELSAFQSADTFFAGLLTGINTLHFPQQMRVIGVYHGYRSLEIPIDRYAPLYTKNLKDAIKESLKILGKKYYFQYKLNDMRQTIEKCTEIIGVSQHSGYATQVFFPELNRQKVHVYFSPEKYTVTAAASKNNHEKTILMLGGNRWVKNFYRGAKALDTLFSKGLLNGYTVAVVGGIPKRVLRRIINKNRFVPFSYLTAEELEQKYVDCDFFFYPTLNEGFGYPPQEVMKYGKTCVISAITSLPEIYLDAVYYCNPYDITEMQTRLLQASEKKIPVEWVLTGYQRIAKKQKEDLDKLCYLIMQ